MPRKRLTAKHLPPRVYFKHGAYYYVHPPGTKPVWERLGKTLPEMYRNYAKVIESPHIRCRTMNQLFDRYMAEIAPNKAERSFKNDLNMMPYLRQMFGEMIPSTVTPVDIYQYLDIRAKRSIVRANREVSLLSHVFTCAVRWGVVLSNPCRDVKRFKEKQRDIYINKKDFEGFLSVSTPVINVAARLTFLLALRQGELLQLKVTDFQKEQIAIYMPKVKRYKYLGYGESSDAIRSAFHDALKLYKHEREYLICTRKGHPYTPLGFDSLWQRCMLKAIKLGKVQQRFAFRDLRSWAATIAENKYGRDYSSRLLGHATPVTTDKYIRKREILALRD